MNFDDPSMFPRRAVLQVALAAPLFNLAGCTSNNASYRFRMTVEADTPEGIRAGSSVYEISAGDHDTPWPDSMKRYIDTKGEAVAVDLPDGQALFALLKTNAHFNDMATLSMEAFDPQFLDPPGWDHAANRPGESGILKYDVVRSANRIERGEGIRSPAVVDPESYPMFVTFADIDDPTSVQLVDPDDLAAAFGEGYALKRITVEITDDPVTRGIEERLGWLDSQIGSLVRRPRDVPIGEMPIEHRLTELDFRQGVS